MKGFISIKKGSSPMRFLKFALAAGSMLAATAAGAQARKQSTMCRWTVEDEVCAKAGIEKVAAQLK
jgi:uncharacterized OsmC-like protein